VFKIKQLIDFLLIYNYLKISYIKEKKKRILIT